MGMEWEKVKKLTDCSLAAGYENPHCRGFYLIFIHHPGGLGVAVDKTDILLDISSAEPYSVPHLLAAVDKTPPKQERPPDRPGCHVRHGSGTPATGEHSFRGTLATTRVECSLRLGTTQAAAALFSARTKRVSQESSNLRPPGDQAGGRNFGDLRL